MKRAILLVFTGLAIACADEVGPSADVGLGDVVSGTSATVDVGG